jgi:hypothetical protein
MRFASRASASPLRTGVVFCLALLIIAPRVALAAIAFQGINAPVIFIPPTNPKGTITFTVGSPPFLTALVNTCKPFGGFCTFGWRIRNAGVPFFPVPNGIPLIMDNTLSNSPVFAPTGVWGIWDPPATEIVPDQVIRVFELFTGVNPSASPLDTIDLAGLQTVQGYPGLTVASFPTSINIQPPIGLNPAVNIISNDFIGLTTGIHYPTTLAESSFATLDADIAALAPGTPNPYDTFFQGAAGRVVISYADVPMKDTIGFAEPVPEPATWLLVVASLVTLLGYGSCLQRSQNQSRFS